VRHVAKIKSLVVVLILLSTAGGQEKKLSADLAAGFIGCYQSSSGSAPRRFELLAEPYSKIPGTLKMKISDREFSNNHYNVVSG
jgi:hypothetical protein